VNNAIAEKLTNILWGHDVFSVSWIVGAELSIAFRPPGLIKKVEKKIISWRWTV
jgi:hypothetical protein